MKEMKNDFFPCILVEHNDDYYSIILSNFYYFDDFFEGKDIGGGYGTERLVKKIVKENGIKNVKFDSEAGMFCAYSGDKNALFQLCLILRGITGDESKYKGLEVSSLIPYNEAEKLLFAGYIYETQKKSTRRILKEHSNALFVNTR